MTQVNYQASFSCFHIVIIIFAVDTSCNLHVIDDGDARALVDEAVVLEFLKKHM